MNDELQRIGQLARLGRLEEAEAACREWTERAPQEPQAWSWLGMLRLARQAHIEAEPALRQAVALQPTDAGYWSQLSLVLRGLSKNAEAESAIRRALELDDADSHHWNCLGGFLSDQRRWSQAAEAYRAALKRQPGDAATWGQLGTMERRLGNLDAAEQAIQRALTLAPGDPAALTKYADLLALRGKPQPAIDLARRILAQAPQLAEAWMVLAEASATLGDYPQAEKAFRHALQAAPNDPLAQYGLAMMLLKGGFIVEAQAGLTELVAKHPDFAEAWILLGSTQQARGEIDAALVTLRRGVSVSKDPAQHSKLLHSLQCADGVDPGDLLAAHREWDATHAQPVAPTNAPFSPRRNSGRPLRLGFVSSDFCLNPSGFLVLRALECRDKSQATVVCYSDLGREDEYTDRFRAAADVWRPTLGLNAAELARQIRQDEIDILFDLMGHVGKQLMVFAHRPAPLQITWLGYVGTTGLAAMDCLLADRFHVRPGEDHWYTETVLRMPNDYACYGPPISAPEVGELPALAAGRVTFGCLNHPSKYTPRLFDTWAAVLQRVPTARLLLKNSGLDQAEIQNSLRGRFAERGIAPERVLMEGGAPHRDFMAAYQRIDLALDTQPYSGGLTTCEALWMGVPVITWPGRTFAGRHATSHLTNAGYEQFIAADEAGYLDLAVHWAERMDELAIIRAQMRERVRRSPLCDGQAFARDFLSLLTTAWNERLVV